MIRVARRCTRCDSCRKRSRERRILLRSRRAIPGAGAAAERAGCGHRETATTVRPCAGDWRRWLPRVQERRRMRSGAQREGPRAHCSERSSAGSKPPLPAKEDLSSALAHAAGQIAKLGMAKRGDKTMLDALIPAAEAAGAVPSGDAAQAAFTWLEEIDDLPVASEGDALGAVTQIVARALSGRVGYLLDMTEPDLDAGQLLMWHGGGGPLYLADDAGARWVNHPMIGRGTEQGPIYGAIADLVFRDGPVTVFRVARDAGALFEMTAEVAPARPVRLYRLPRVARFISHRRRGGFAGGGRGIRHEPRTGAPLRPRSGRRGRRAGGVRVLDRDAAPGPQADADPPVNRRFQLRRGRGQSCRRGRCRCRRAARPRPRASGGGPARGASTALR